MLYRSLAKPLLFRLDAEDAHHLTLRGLQLAGRVPFAARAAAGLLGQPSPILRQNLWGLDFASPVGLAAGLDKNAEAVPMFGALGFGFLEVGTVTPRPQAGNERPRLFRLPEDSALINRMGFNNVGAGAMARNLGHGAHPIPIAVNIGKNKATPNEAAALDYRACVRTLYPHADFFVVNVSSPNTPGLRALQHGDELKALLREVLAEVEVQRVRTALRARPVLVKIAPDLGVADHEATVQAAVDAGVQGLVVSNTTLGREGLTHAQREQAGGLSGAPLREMSTRMVRATRRLTRLPIIGVGGVFTAQDAYAKIRAGASLVEIYTALIYEGPQVVRQINAGLSELLARDSFNSVSEAIGADA